MPGENILIIAVDGLRAASLGAYGNTAYATPASDQLAAESFLLDACFAGSVDLAQIYQALWQSRLPRELAARGYKTTILSDDPALAAFPTTADFDDLVQLTEASPTRARDISQTALARLFTAACDAIESAGAKQMIWLHSRGMYGAWDAPLELQEQLLALDEGDPPPADVLEPPYVVLDDARDSDAAFRWSCAYAAQVMVFDACLDAVRESVAASKQPWLVVLLGTRGFPLGEHGRVGGVDPRLYTEQLHVPLLWRLPDGSDRLARSSSLTTHADLLPTLSAWLDGKPFADPSRDELVATSGDGSASIRTAEWTLRCPAAASTDDGTADSDANPCELFVRPDDRWEANDVAALCPDVVEDLRGRLNTAIASTPAAAESH